MKDLRSCDDQGTIDERDGPVWTADLFPCLDGARCDVGELLHGQPRDGVIASRPDDRDPIPLRRRSP